jgi:hypothetical protein
MHEHFQLLPSLSCLTKGTAHVRVDRHQISMQTHLNTMGAPNSSATRQLLEARASSTAQTRPDAGAEDEASDGAGEASPSLSNNGGINNSDGKRKMSQDGTAPPRENGEQASSAELPGRKARVSVRARSEAPMV